MDTTEKDKEQIISYKEPPRSSEETRVNVKNKMTVPLMLGIGLIGIVLMIILLASIFTPKKVITPTTPTPLPTLNPISKVTSTPQPKRKIASDSAIQIILDAESSADASLNNTDFIEQKLIPPTLDMSLNFEK